MRLSTDLSLSRRWSAEAAAVRRPLALGLMVASGFAGLGYQIVWTRQNIAVEFALHGGFVAGPLSLRRFAGDAGRRLRLAPRQKRRCSATAALSTAAHAP